jgi:hypothetical protein
MSRWVKTETNGAERESPKEAVCPKIDEWPCPGEALFNDTG